MRFGFLNVQQIVTHTSEGNVGLPILYKDVAAVTALFPASMDAVSALLRDTGLEAVPVRDGQPMVALAFFRYDATSIGAYNEGALATLVVQQGAPIPRIPMLDMFRGAGSRKAMTYIIDLPVTTAAANAAGREIWGFPKFVTPIPFSLQDGRLETSILDPDGKSDIVTLSGDLGAGVPVPAGDMVLLSHLHGEPVRTLIEVSASMRAHRGSGLTLRIGASTHPMAQRLRSLGLDGAAPMLVQSTQRFQSRLHAGVRLTPPW